MADIVRFKGITKADLPPERVLDGAKEAGLKTVLVIGLHEDDRFFFSSTDGAVSDVFWLLEVAKRKLIDLSLPDDGPFK